MTENELIKLKEFFIANEDWLMERILRYAIKRGYAKYTSTLKEAWRLSISGLNGSITEAVKIFGEAPELSPEEKIEDDPVASFGVIEARRHRERGINLTMFLGLMKYYRQSYIDLIRSRGESDCQEFYENFINRIFDRIEIGFCEEWTGTEKEEVIHELQISNRVMTNEKNKFLTIFESLLNPVIIINREKTIENINNAAIKLFKADMTPGSQQYSPKGHAKLAAKEFPSNTAFLPLYTGSKLSRLFPWLEDEIDLFLNKDHESMVFEEKVTLENRTIYFRIKMSGNLDMSGKFNGVIIILEDITGLKRALDEVKTLRGILPICSYCKKIRDDEGYWQRVESYVGHRSDAEFSHGICPECTKIHFPD